MQHARYFDKLGRFELTQDQNGFSCQVHFPAEYSELCSLILPQLKLELLPSGPDRVSIFTGDERIARHYVNKLFEKAYPREKQLGNFLLVDRIDIGIIFDYDKGVIEFESGGHSAPFCNWGLPVTTKDIQEIELGYAEGCENAMRMKLLHGLINVVGALTTGDQAEGMLARAYQGAETHRFQKPRQRVIKVQVDYEDRELAIREGHQSILGTELHAALGVPSTHDLIWLGTKAPDKDDVENLLNRNESSFHIADGDRFMLRAKAPAKPADFVYIHGS